MRVSDYGALGTGKTMNQLVEELVEEYGEVRRPLIVDALNYLSEAQARWMVKDFDARVYIRELIIKKENLNERVPDRNDKAD